MVYRVSLVHVRLQSRGFTFPRIRGTITDADAGGSTVKFRRPIPGAIPCRVASPGECASSVHLLGLALSRFYLAEASGCLGWRGNSPWGRISLPARCPDAPPP